ncbi:MAG: DUF192 domain-containing protein [Actinobacteria bacterium]|nr:MAG: DUF192 domain-containing protein [Actinomycetota bacterium]
MRATLRIFSLLASAAMLSGCAVATAPRVSLAGESVAPYLADTMRERADGLQGFDGLASGEGMVFVYPDARVRTFGMKNVGFAIDIVFIGLDGTVSGIASLEPGDPRKIESPGPSRFVVELPKGWAAEHGVVVGSRFTYDDGR